MAHSQPWLLAGFAEGLDEWIDQETPPEDVRLRVTAWVLTRIDDPFESARREPTFDDLWSVIVPGSIHAPQQVVHCSFWIERDLRRVRCNLIASLSYPA